MTIPSGSPRSLEPRRARHTVVGDLLSLR